MTYVICIFAYTTLKYFSMLIYRAMQVLLLLIYEQEIRAPARRLVPRFNYKLYKEWTKNINLIEDKVKYEY